MDRDKKTSGLLPGPTSVCLKKRMIRCAEGYKISPIKLCNFLLVILALSGAGHVSARDTINDSNTAKLKELLNYSLEQLMNIQISTASKFFEQNYDAPGIVSVITGHEISRYGATNLFEILARAPSVLMTGTYGSPQNIISIRGDQTPHFNQRVLLLLNGRPLREGTQGGNNVNFLTSFPVGLIKQIEIVRGPGSVLYGSNAYNGTINIITKQTADESGGNIKLSAGSYEGRGVDLAAYTQSDQLLSVGGIHVFKENGWQQTVTDEASVTDEAQFGEKNIGAFGQMLYQNFTASAFISSRSADDFGTVPLLPLVEREFDYYFIDLGYQLTLSPEWSMGTNLTYNRIEQSLPYELPPPDPERLESLSESALLEITAKYTPSHDFNLVAGAIADRHRGHLGDSTLVHVPSFDEWWYQAYTQMSWWPQQDLKLVLGLQWNKIEAIDAKTVPRAALIYSINQNWHMKLLSGQAYRAAYPLERNITSPPPVLLTGNPDLVPETVTTSEIQLAYHNEELEGALTIFRNKQTDQITRTSGAPITWINEGEIEFQGVEFESKYSPIKRFYINASYLYQANERKDGIKNTTLIPNNIWKLGIAYEFDAGINAGIFNTHVGKAHDNVILNPVRLEVNPQADAYNELSINVNFNLSKLLDFSNDHPVTVSLYATNLLDEEIYIPEYGRKIINTVPIAAGRAVYASLAMEY